MIAGCDIAAAIAASLDAVVTTVVAASVDPGSEGGTEVPGSGSPVDVML